MFDLFFIQTITAVYYYYYNHMKPQTSSKILIKVPDQPSSFKKYTQKPHLETIFKGFKRQTEINKLNKLNRITAKEYLTTTVGPRGPFEAFTWVLLKGIFAQNLKQDVLYILKSIIMNEELNNFTSDSQQFQLPPKLTPSRSQQLLLKFLSEMSSSHSLNKSFEQKIQENFLMMDIMVYTLKKLVDSSFLKDRKSVKSINSEYQVLINYFDLNCRNQGSLFLFYEDSLFITGIQTNEVLFGEYFNLSERKENMRRSKMNQKEGINKGASLGIQGISDSVIMEVDADTPSFNFEDSQISFRSSILSEQDELNSKASLKTLKESESPLKNNDRKHQMKESQCFFGSSSIRKSLEQKLSRGCDPQGFFKTLDSPLTATHTPKTFMHQSLCFETKIQSNMKRSDYCCQHLSQHKKDINEIQQYKEENVVQKCICLPEKGEKNKLCSNLYDISILVVTEGNQMFLSNRDIKIFIVSKGLNLEVFCKKTNQQNIQFSSDKGLIKNFPRKMVSPSRSIKELSASITQNNVETYSLFTSPAAKGRNKTNGTLFIPSFLRRKNKQ